MVGGWVWCIILRYGIMSVVMKEEYVRLLAEAADRFSQMKRYFERLKATKPRDLDERVARLHREVFSEIDCRECGNCCRAESPRFNTADVNRLASEFGMSPTEFRRAYLHVDGDEEHVLKDLPCPFLHDDAVCFIYEKRPRDCASYPHTGERVRGILNKTLLNTRVCPAVFLIFQRLRKELVL